MTKLTEEALQQFTGSEAFYRHALHWGLIYTEGIKFLAEEAGAYWLVDTIAIHLGSPRFQAAIKQDQRIGVMHFWKLSVQPDRSAQLIARADTPDPPFLEDTIPWTDFPLEEADLWVAANEEGWTLMLPGEY